MKKEEIYDLPDLQFAKWCEQTFAINRGVYNTIDGKLFDLGYKNIRLRRKAIVAFLQQHVERTDKKYYKFGHGNLSNALQNFHKFFTLIT